MPIGPYDVGSHDYGDMNTLVVRYVENIDKSLSLRSERIGRNFSLVISFDKHKNPFLVGLENPWIKQKLIGIYKGIGWSEVEIGDHSITLIV